MVTTVLYVCTLKIFNCLSVTLCSLNWIDAYSSPYAKFPLCLEHVFLNGQFCVKFHIDLFANFNILMDLVN